MANLRQEISVGSTGDEFVAAFTTNTKNANIRVYNVEDYGAVHDGETDDTEAIQDAINACFDVGGGIVYFPRGVYLLTGALKNDIGENTVDYNSQLYIPATKYDTHTPTIYLLGETCTPRLHDNSGVVLKSTIAGTGSWPSVICSRAWNEYYQYINYTNLIIENITVLVNRFYGTSGISMSGINALYASHTILRNVCVAPYDAYETREDNINNLTLSANHSFGIGIGIYQGDFSEIQGTVTVRGFYYGIILGEGVRADKIFAYFNYIGLMSMINRDANLVNYYISNWNAHDISSQFEAVYIMGGISVLKIEICSIEDWTTLGPSWCEKQHYILDNDDYLYGRMDFQVLGGGGISKTSGGTNFLVRNINTGSGYYWTTATRPSSPGLGCTGFNTTSSKLEVYNGTTWVDLH